MPAYDAVPTPAVVVELEIAKRNIKDIIEGARKYGIAHRPHIKTHKCAELAKLQLSLGAKGIACAKLGEAEVMADAGIDDILVTYPIVGADKLRRYAELHKKCTLRSIINSEAGARGLSDAAQEEGACFEVLIELDGGVRRGGVGPMEPALGFAKSVADFPGLEIVGLMYYPGLIYGQTTEEGISRIAEKERDDLADTAELLRRHGFDIRILSGGNTPSSKRPHCLEGITEIRCGNYIFNDCAQLYNSQVSVGDCALRVVSTVVAVVDGHNAIIDAGTKTLSSDAFLNCAGQYGHIVGHGGMTLFNLNEEHGFLRSEGPMPLKVGDRVAIIPNHACVVCNLTDEIFMFEGGAFSHKSKIDARGRAN